MSFSKPSSSLLLYLCEVHVFLAVLTVSLVRRLLLSILLSFLISSPDGACPVHRCSCDPGRKRRKRRRGAIRATVLHPGAAVFTCVVFFTSRLFDFNINLRQELTLWLTRLVSLLGSIKNGPKECGGRIIQNHHRPSLYRSFSATALSKIHHDMCSINRVGAVLCCVGFVQLLSVSYNLSITKWISQLLFLIIKT